MAVDTTQFSKVDEFGPVSKLERTVDTPMPANDDGSGYTTEENRQVCYSFDEHEIKVSKVSNLGWSVTLYEEGDVAEMSHYFDEEQTAHERAREMVEEVLADD